MKICIVGAGAIGGFIGTKLACSPAAVSGEISVSALARGATLAALQQHGWRLRLSGKDAGQTLQAPATASDDAAQLGAQDLVIIAVKGQALAAAVRDIAPLLGENTIVMPAMNGVPWWFCQGLDLPELAAPLLALDANGSISAAIDYHRVLGCVVHASTFCPEPGVVQHKMAQGLIVGEPSGVDSLRTSDIVSVLSQARFDVTLSAHIRYDIWYKLWGNMTMNPVSAITGATADQILNDPLVRDFCTATMREAAAIGEKLGCMITQKPEDRHAITASMGTFKTSMLQDVEAGRSIELDAIVGAAHEIGQRLSIPTPNIGALLGLTRLFAQGRNLYNPFFIQK